MDTGREGNESSFGYYEGSESSEDAEYEGTEDGEAQNTKDEEAEGTEDAGSKEGSEAPWTGRPLPKRERAATTTIYGHLQRRLVLLWPRNVTECTGYGIFK